MTLRRAQIALVLAALALCALAGTAHAAPFKARGSVEQVYVTDAKPGAKLKLVDRRGRIVAKRKVNKLGALLFRRVEPGRGYRVKAAGGGGSSPKLRVLSTRPAPPDPSIYKQKIPSDGYGYLTTRDGTKLAINVHPPSDVSAILPTGEIPKPPTTPTPTLIEYSGYGYADPAGPESGIALIGNLMGFTVVDVNMRGTGCSGGAFDFFEPLQSLDGYDVIETIARQPWVKGGKVGMMGISYGGISQLFTAQTNPPSLAAITPISLIDNTQTTLYPGGVLNTGFAYEWAKDRIEDGLPAGPDQGQPWAWERIQQGDKVCEANQALHAEAADLERKIRRNDHYRPRVADPLAPVTFVDKIKAPVFLACQWQDEQTGGHCPTLASRFKRSDRKWFTFTNGTHIDALAPHTFNRWFDFLQLYVAKRPPIQYAPLLRVVSGLLFEQAMGIPNLTLPPDPVQQQLTYESALKAFESQPSVRVQFENGAGRAPGEPYPTFERSFAKLPVPGTKGGSWYLAGKGALRGKAPRSAGADRFTWDDDARPPTNFSGNTGSGSGGLWTKTPEYKWTQNPKGKAVSYVSEPLAKDTTVVGAGYVRVWVRSSKPRVDLQATVTEVRPDGKEVFVQSGWLRGDMRKLDRRKSKPLEPVLSLRKEDRKPLPKNSFVKATIPLYYQGHAYRAGSRIRVTISAVGGDQPVWAFAEARPKGTARVDIAHGAKRPSRLTLPVVPGVDPPDALPPCPSLRAQPCRDYKPFANKPVKP